MASHTSLGDLLGEKVLSINPLAGGDIADVMLIVTNHNKYVLKRPRAGQNDTTAIEAHMLRMLQKKSPLPVPTIIAQKDGMLLMDYIDHAGGSMRGNAAIDGARHIAGLHGVRGALYGYEIDTVIGPLTQINTPETSWVTFYGEHRLNDMAMRAHKAGRLPSVTLKRLENFITNLADYIPDNPEPSLLHGDLWGGNILVDNDHVAAFIDPAIYWGHAEIDLAFLTLFNSAGDDFFEAYSDINPIDAGFFEERRDIYNLWPLLVHVRLFGGSYVSSVESILNKVGQ